MKCFVAVLGLLAVASANPGAPQLATYSYANPAGVTFRGSGFAPGFAIGPAQPVAAHYANAGPGVQYAAAAPAVQYAQAAPALQYAQAAPAYQYAQAAPALQYHHAPAVAVTQKVGYAHHQIPVNYAGHADVPVTKQVLTKGVTQQLVDVAQPAVTNRRVKVRRPALRKEFYDIEHRVIVRPAGSATLELSQPISKEQKGPAVLTPTNYQQIAPVVRYGNSRQIIDGEGVSSVAQIRANLARGIQAGPAQQQQYAQPPPQQQPQPQPQQFEQQQPQPQLRSVEQGPPQQQEQQQFAQPPPQQQQQQQQQFAQPPPQQQQQQQQQFAQPPPQQQQQQQQQYSQPPPQQQQQQQQGPAPAPRLRPLQLRPQQQPQLRSADAEIVDAAPQEQQQQQQQRPVPQQRPAPQQGPGPQQGPPPQQFQGGRVNLPQMPVELQARLLELLSGKGGTVTEVLGQDGRPNSASVLQVADSIQDLDLQGGERITTRRIVVTRPIETIQEVDIQEPATKIHRHLVNTPTLFKSNVQGVARVPVNIPGVKNVATPVLQTHYAAAAPAYAGYAAAPAYAGYAGAGLQY